MLALTCINVFAEVLCALFLLEQISYEYRDESEDKCYGKYYRNYKQPYVGVARCMIMVVFSIVGAVGCADINCNVGRRVVDKHVYSVVFVVVYSQVNQSLRIIVGGVVVTGLTVCRSFGIEGNIALIVIQRIGVAHCAVTCRSLAFFKIAACHKFVELGFVV